MYNMVVSATCKSPPDLALTRYPPRALGCLPRLAGQVQDGWMRLIRGQTLRPVRLEEGLSVQAKYVLT
jgi:hypothetical protein